MPIDDLDSLDNVEELIAVSSSTVSGPVILRFRETLLDSGVNIATVGYTLVDTKRAVVLARTQNGLALDAPGLASAIVSFPFGFIGQIRWDNNGTIFAVEDVDLSDAPLPINSTSVIPSASGGSYFPPGYLLGDYLPADYFSHSILKTLSVIPTLPLNSSAGAIFWTVQPILIAANGSQTLGPVSAPNQFYLDIPSSILDGVGQATYQAMSQTTDPLSELSFELTGIDPGPGRVFQELMGASAPPMPPIKLAFSVSLTPGQESLFRIWKTSLMDFTPPLAVAGTWTLTAAKEMPKRWQPLNECMVFNSSEILLPNYRYSIEVDSALMSTDGQTLQEPVRSEFLSYYRPFHVDPYRVRQRLGEHSKNVLPEDLNWAIWRASMRANRELMWFIPIVVYRGGPREQDVANFTTQNTMALNGFVELEATIRLFEKLIGRAAEDSGISESFKESEVSVSPERVKAIEAAIKALRPEWETYRAEISFKRARPRSAIKSGMWRGGRDYSWRGRSRF